MTQRGALLGLVMRVARHAAIPAAGNLQKLTSPASSAALRHSIPRAGARPSPSPRWLTGLGSSPSLPTVTPFMRRWLSTCSSSAPRPGMSHTPGPAFGLLRPLIINPAGAALCRGPSLRVPCAAGGTFRVPAVKGLGSPLAMRCASNLASSASSTASKVLQRAASALGPRRSTALSLQVRSWWQRHVNILYFATAALAVYLIWRLLFAFTSIFVSINSMFAEYGFMALAACIVLLSFLYVRSYYAVDPAKVYRLAMRRLNMSPGVLEVLGAPLLGTELRASVLTGGGMYIGKGLTPKLRTRRCQMIFPLHGAERRGLVSLEAKKKQGKYVFKLLAVDVTVPAPASGSGAGAADAAGGASGGVIHHAGSPGVAVVGEHQRIYVDGDSALYHRGGILNELRDPFLRAQSLQQTYDAEDEVDDELSFLEHERRETAAREQAEAQQSDTEARLSAAQADAAATAAASPPPPPPHAAQAAVSAHAAEEALQRAPQNGAGEEAVPGTTRSWWGFVTGSSKAPASPLPP